MSLHNASTTTQTGDPLARLIREKFEEAKQARQAIEQERWQPGEDAYQGRIYQTIRTGDSSIDVRLNLTRRKTHGAVTKISSMLFEQGEVPFKMRVSRHLRFAPPDIAPGAEHMSQMSENERQQYLEILQQQGIPIPKLLEERRVNLENRVRDILEQTDFLGEMTNSLHEMCLHGTGVLKSPVLYHRNYPVYRGKYVNPNDYALEQLLESEILPCAQFVSCFSLFPSPDATKIEDAEYVIERRYLSSIQIRQMIQQGLIQDVEATLDVLDREVAIDNGDDSAPPDPIRIAKGYEVKQYEWLEFYGYLDRADIEDKMDASFLEEEVLPVKIVMIGDRVVEVGPHPYDGVHPYHLMYWQRNPQSLWGDGIYWSLADLQDHSNFALSMFVLGKHMAAMPMMVMDESALAAGETLGDLGPGRVFKSRSGQVDNTMRPLLVPDVSQGLMELLQYLEREADLITGQSAIGYGESSPHQTKTATGMSLLQNAQLRLMSTVVRSVSAAMQDSIEGIYRWLMTDSDDQSIKLDAEAYSTGYDRYIASEIHNQQLLQFLQLIGGMPQISQHIDITKLLPSILRAYRLDPEMLIKSPEQVAQESQAGMESQFKMKVAEQEMQMQIEQMKLQHQAAMLEAESRFKEMLAISDDRRQLQMQERLERLKAGEMLGDPGDMSQHSFLLKDQMMREQQQQYAQQQALAAQTANRGGGTLSVPGEPSLDMAATPDSGANPNASTANGGRPTPPGETAPTQLPSRPGGIPSRVGGAAQPNLQPVDQAGP